ncbi:MAG: hypothetical protein IPP25_19580 [Saprospiraceae bacterium]|nr:hypothetical protein [Candidatus Opimibacter skivensis]
MSQEEIFRFKNIKESEKLFQRSLTEDNFVKKLDYINKAIELNPSNIDFSLFRAEIYYFLNEYEQAIQESSRILKDVIFSSRAIQVKGNSFIRLRKYKEAKDFFRGNRNGR